MIFCHKNEKEITLGADSAQENRGSRAKVSNHDQATLMDSGKFRKDLYYRLCFHQIHIPPLRERLDDLPLLMDHFLKMASREFGKKIPTPPLGLVSLLSNYNYPGNIREFKSMVYDAVACHESKVMAMTRFEAYLKKREPLSRLLSESFPGLQSIRFSDSEPIPTLEKTIGLLVAEAMKRSGNNQTMAARFLGISRQRLGRYLKSLSR